MLMLCILNYASTSFLLGCFYFNIFVCIRSINYIAIYSISINGWIPCAEQSQDMASQSMATRIPKLVLNPATPKGAQL